jgi:hypothetical protein
MGSLAALTTLRATAAWASLVPLGLVRLRARPGPSIALLAAAALGVLGRGLVPVLAVAGMAAATDAAGFVWLMTSLPQDDVLLFARLVSRVVIFVAEAPAWALLVVGAWGFVRASAPSGVEAADRAPSTGGAQRRPGPGRET